MSVGRCAGYCQWQHGPDVSEVRVHRLALPQPKHRRREVQGVREAVHRVFWHTTAFDEGSQPARRPRFQGAIADVHGLPFHRGHECKDRVVARPLPPESAAVQVLPNILIWTKSSGDKKAIRDGLNKSPQRVVAGNQLLSGGISA